MNKTREERRQACFSSDFPHRRPVWPDHLYLCKEDHHGPQLSMLTMQQQMSGVVHSDLMQDVTIKD